MSKPQVLIDSDAFVGWMVETDAHHQRSTTLFQKLQRRKAHLLTTNLVITETASWLSYRAGQTKAKAFVDFSQQIETVFVTEKLHTATVRLFAQQDRNRTSFVDMANVIVAREMRIGEIFSFDKVYRKSFDLTLVV